jgi:hypothetical protein
VLTVGAMYCVSLMDRTNLGAANIAGMGKDLLLIGNRYVSARCLLMLGFSNGVVCGGCCAGRCGAVSCECECVADMGCVVDRVSSRSSSSSRTLSSSRRRRLL